MDKYNDYIDNELTLIKKYSALLNEYYFRLSDKRKMPFINEVDPLLKERGMDTMEELILFLVNEQYKERLNSRELLKLRMDLALIFNHCFDQLKSLRKLPRKK